MIKFIDLNKNNRNKSLINKSIETIDIKIWE